jgi:hypothetical membrane protein
MSRWSTNALLWCGAIGAPLFVVVFIVEGATRPDYDPIRLPISLLSLGDLGWTQRANFVVDGILLLAFTIGLQRRFAATGRLSRSGPILLGLAAAGLVGAGLFPTDPGGGYPPGVPSIGSMSGTLHDLATLVIFVSLALAAVAIGRHFALHGETAWAALSVATGAIIAIGFVLMVIAFNGRNDITPIGGLVQRAAVSETWAWMGLVAIHEIRRPYRSR